MIYSEINHNGGLRGTHRHLKAFKLPSSMPPRKIGMAPSVKYIAFPKGGDMTRVAEPAENN
jgi:hypothetical protein